MASLGGGKRAGIARIHLGMSLGDSQLRLGPISGRSSLALATGPASPFNPFPLERDAPKGPFQPHPVRESACPVDGREIPFRRRYSRWEQSALLKRHSLAGTEPFSSCLSSPPRAVLGIQHSFGIHVPAFGRGRDVHNPCGCIMDAVPVSDTGGQFPPCPAASQGDPEASPCARAGSRVGMPTEPRGEAGMSCSSGLGMPE